VSDMVRYETIEVVSVKLGITKRHAQRLCIEGKLPGARKRKGEWEVPVTADARLRGDNSPGQQADTQLAGFIEKINQAKKLLGIVLQFIERAADRVRYGGTRTDALEQCAA